MPTRQGRDGGRGDPLRIMLSRVVYCARNEADRREKLEMAHEYYRRFDNVFTGLVKDVAALPRVQTIEELDANILIATPEQMIDELGARRRIDEFILSSHLDSHWRRRPRCCIGSHRGDAAGRRRGGAVGDGRGESGGVAAHGARDRQPKGHLEGLPPPSNPTSPVCVSISVGTETARCHRSRPPWTNWSTTSKGCGTDSATTGSMSSGTASAA